jgi:hypothetical protein
MQGVPSAALLLAASPGVRHWHDRPLACVPTQQRPAREILLGPGNARREKRQVGEVGEHDERQQRTSAAVDAPAEYSIPELDNERGER